MDRVEGASAAVAALSSATPHSAVRLHALDHLRALAMLAGVLFHAALAYSPLARPFWPAADRAGSALVDALIWLPHLLRMPLFFLVAGYFAAMLLTRDGMGGLVRQRLRRILVPFLVAWPLVHLSTAAATVWAAEHVAHPSAVLGMVRAWLAMDDPPRLPPGTGHLWFLYYLLLFTLLLWIVRVLEFDRLLARAMALGPAVVALGLPLLLWPAFALTSAPHPAPESVLPQFWAIGLYAPFFALGVGLHGRLDWLTPLQRWLPAGVLLCLSFYALFLLRLGTADADALYPMASAELALLQATIAAWGTLACLIAGMRWLQRPAPLLGYLARSAYWTYLLHLPLLLLAQYLLMDLAIAWPAKFALAVGGTLALCLLSYATLVRRTPLRRWVG